MAFGSHRTRVIVVVLAIVVLATLAWGAVAGNLLVKTDPVGTPDAIFALSGDPLGDRVGRAIAAAAGSDAGRLVIFLDGGPRPESPEQMKRHAVEAGVPGDAIRFVSGIDSTAMEAGIAAGLVERCGWRELVVVTSPYHTRRAGWTFQRAVGSVAEVRTVASAESFDEWGWWRTHRDRLSVASEWAKGIGALWYVASPPDPVATKTPC
jgi:uncharacterized SAM-binding protein YcdF (DUF218 family)